MTINEAVKILRQHNITGASVQRITNGRTLEKDLLAQVLNACESLMTERTEYKRLLKVAVEDFANMNYHIYECDGMCDTCPIHGNRDECDKWRYADEALALIGDEPNGI